MLTEVLNTVLEKAIHVPRADTARVVSLLRSETQKCCTTRNILTSVPRAATQATKSQPWVWIQTGIQGLYHLTMTMSLTKLRSGSSEPSS